VVPRSRQVQLLNLFTVNCKRGHQLWGIEYVVNSERFQPEVCGLLSKLVLSNMSQLGLSGEVVGLTVAGQQMRTSYLRPASSCCRRYQDSRPWGAALEGNCTGSWEGRIVCACDKVCNRRSSRLGRASGRVTAAGARNMVFSTLAFTVQA
jgi:hypothetical protein